MGYMSEQNNFEEEFLELEATQEEIEIALLADRSMIELKREEFLPIFDEYYGSSRVDAFDFLSIDDFAMSKQEIEQKSKKKLKDPKGGLTAAGRAYFKRTEGANLKPGVKGPADTPEKMRRKGSFLTRFFTNPSGPMKDEKGRATRLALSAAAWGEPVPQNAEDAAALAAKGRRLLERYANKKKKKSDNVKTEHKSDTFGLVNTMADRWVMDDDSSDNIEYRSARRRSVRKELLRKSMSIGRDKFDPRVYRLISARKRSRR
jgi:hypothetical protein